MQKNPVCYYYKDPETGVEMHFSKYPDWGWTVGFHGIDFEQSLDYKGITMKIMLSMGCK